MEDLIRLVDESFARCGIADFPARRSAGSDSSLAAETLPPALPERNFRKSLSPDPATELVGAAADHNQKL